MEICIVIHMWLCRSHDYDDHFGFVEFIYKKEEEEEEGGGWFIALLENKARYIQELELFGALLSRGLLFESNMQYGIS